MTYKHNICALVGVAMLVTGCSTRPRNFTAELSAPVADRMAFESDFRTCQTLVRQGRKSDFKGAAASALATGVGTVGAGAAMVGTGLVGITTGGGAAALATAAMPVVGVFLGFGVSRMIRSGKEGKYKRAMNTCLDEYGYGVSRWSTVKKKDDAAKIAAGKASVQSTDPVIATSSVEPVVAIPAPDTATLTPASAIEPES